MKKSIMLSILGLAIAGCASNFVKLSDAEKQRIANGTDIKFTNVGEALLFKTGVIDKSKTRDGIYVCAVSTDSPTISSSCYPNLSAYIGKYFSDAGVKLAASKSNADEIVFVTQ